MSNTEQVICTRCLTPFTRGDAVPEEQRPSECAVCLKLGDRSLVWFQRAFRAATSDEARAAIRAKFDAARGRSRMRGEEAVR